MGRDLADELAAQTFLVACEGDYPAVTYVFPGDGPSVCRRLGLVPLSPE